MNKNIILSAFLSIVFILPNMSFALPAPCSQEELLESSDFAVEGRVTKVECGAPYESTECTANDDSKTFVPELQAKCTATLKVSESIKGDYKIGDEAIIPYLQLVQQCENGTHSIPGSPVKNFVPNSVIKYYNSEQCKFWNYLKISVPPSGN